jgi:hypothetical protein
VDLALYRTVQKRAVEAGGLRLVLRALPRVQHREAEAEARALFAEHGCEPAGPWYELALAGCLVAAAAGWPVEALREQLTAQELVGLSGVCEELEAAACPDPPRLKEALRRGQCKDPELVFDGLSAHLSAEYGGGAADYYGRPIAELTDGQLLYWSLLRSAFEEFHLTNKVKNVSRAWLESED